MNNNLIYVYCLSNTLPELCRREEYKDLKCIQVGGFYAIVKMVSTDEFSSENLKRNLADLHWLDTNARLHVWIISLLMEDHTVIPFNFGTIYHSVEALSNFVEDYSGSLVENLLFVEWKEEWAVKIYNNPMTLKEHIDFLSPAAADLEKQIMASSPGKAFLLRRKKVEVIEEEIDRLCKRYGQEIHQEFIRLSHCHSLNNLIPKELSGRNDKMILNASFLIDKDKTIEFASVVKSMKNKYASLGFDIEISGPWPPFSFVSVKEKK